ncbi:MAG: hypothetical protein LBP91_03935 [Coriobacteriales bacterium]|jgi:hypothetical protein|nr:hypothetical protein [Coriobacteriales bacterium]
METYKGHESRYYVLGYGSGVVALVERTSINRWSLSVEDYDIRWDSHKKLFRITKLIKQTLSVVGGQIELADTLKSLNAAYGDGHKMPIGLHKDGCYYD